MIFHNSGIDFSRQNPSKINCKMTSKIAYLNSTHFGLKIRHKIPPRRSQDAHMTPQEDPRRSKTSPRRLQDASKTTPRRLPDASRYPQDGSKPPKTPQNASKTPQDTSQDAPCSPNPSRPPPSFDCDRFLIDLWSIFDRFLMDFRLIFDRYLIDFLNSILIDLGSIFAQRILDPRSLNHPLAVLGGLRPPDPSLLRGSTVAGTRLCRAEDLFHF